MFKIRIVFDKSGKRYELPFEIVEKTFNISKKDKNKLKIEIKRHIARL
jgi:hypothetical protein